jgi:hypothetical protein
LESRTGACSTAESGNSVRPFIHFFQGTQLYYFFRFPCAKSDAVIIYSDQDKGTGWNMGNVPQAVKKHDVHSLDTRTGRVIKGQLAGETGRLFRYSIVRSITGHSPGVV